MVVNELEQLARIYQARCRHPQHWPQPDAMVATPGWHEHRCECGMVVLFQVGEREAA